MSEIFESLQSYSASQWIALGTGLAYVILAAYEKPLCWPFGIISCSVIAIDDFAVYQLYADGILQVMYVIFGFAGLYYWIFRRKASSLKITSLPFRSHLIALGAGFILSVPLAWLLSAYTDAAFGFLDTVTTVFSLWATWLLVKKVIESWLYWIVIDVVYVFLFALRGGDLIAVLYGMYCIIAIWGFYQWRTALRENTVQS